MFALLGHPARVVFGRWNIFAESNPLCFSLFPLLLPGILCNTGSPSGSDKMITSHTPANIFFLIIVMMMINIVMMNSSDLCWLTYLLFFGAGWPKELHRSLQRSEGDYRTILHGKICHWTICHQDNLAPGQFGTRTIWHQDNLTPANLAPWVKTIVRHSSATTFITSVILNSDVHHLGISLPPTLNLTFITPVFITSDIHHA